MTLYEKLENEFNEFCNSNDCEVDKCKYWWTINKDMCHSHFILTKLEEIDIDKEKEQIRAEAIDNFVNALEKLNKKRKGIGIDIIDVFEVEEKLKEQDND